MTLWTAFIMGFRHDPTAPLGNLFFNVVLYAIFIVVHIIMTIPAFKQVVFGSPQGTPPERRIYVIVAVVTWVGVYWLHKPMPGVVFALPEWVHFVGMCLVLLSIVAFYEFATFEAIDSLLGMPGSQLSHSVGSETPLLMEGPYARVRHPMYRAACLLVFSSLLLHPHTGQLLFAAMVSASFLGFVPFEERQLVNARGDEYREYQQKTPYRVFRGIW